MLDPDDDCWNLSVYERVFLTFQVYFCHRYAFLTYAMDRPVSITAISPREKSRFACIFLVIVPVLDL